MTKELQDAIKKVREEIEKERNKLNELENNLVSLNKENQKAAEQREAEIKKMFIQD
jgi:uncharacterized coiled-coil protein SlyX